MQIVTTENHTFNVSHRDYTATSTARSLHGHTFTMFAIVRANSQTLGRQAWSPDVVNARIADTVERLINNSCLIEQHDVQLKRAMGMIRNQHVLVLRTPTTNEGIARWLIDTVLPKALFGLGMTATELSLTNHCEPMVEVFLT